MGESYGFIAFKGRAKADVLDAFELEETGEVRENHYLRKTFSIAELENGWTVIVSGDLGFVTPRRLADASAGGEALACEATSVVMGGQAWGYVDGRERWAIEYDCGKDPALSTRGDLPEGFGAVRDKAIAEQTERDAKGASVDVMYDIPADVIESLIGYRNDSNADWEPEYFALARKRGERKGLLAFLFGRR